MGMGVGVRRMAERNVRNLFDIWRKKINVSERKSEKESEGKKKIGDESREIETDNDTGDQEEKEYEKI